jgi:hypothetical protein
MHDYGVCAAFQAEYEGSIPFTRSNTHSPLYPIVRIYRKATEEFRDAALVLRASCSFSPRVRRRVLSPLHCRFCIPLFGATAKTTSSAIKAVAASSAMAPLF